MGQGTITSVLAAVWLTGAALAAEAEVIPMTDGPHGSGRSLGDAWSMGCAPQQRLAGVKVYEDGRSIVGIEALCVTLANGLGGTVWASVPVVAAMPEVSVLRAVMVADEQVDEVARTNVLRVSSGTRRSRGSGALLITIPRQTEVPAAWAMDVPERMTLMTGRHGQEILCKAGAYVQGLRTGIEAGRRGRLMAVQVLCTRGNGRIEAVGDWPTEKKTKKNKDVRALVAARTQCGGGVANPHDGAAAKALIGTAEDGRVVSLGVTCARVAVPGPVSRAMEVARVWLAGVMPAVKRGQKRVYKSPEWYAGSDVAVCRDGSGRGYCAQETANRFCVTMNGARSASSFYVVGGYSGDAIASGGKRCASGACRAFQQINCTG
jgi:hypothetical protein